MIAVNSRRVKSCEVKAFVDATLISGPAFIRKFIPDSLVSVLSATLQIARVFVYFSFSAFFKDEIVSAVSPD